MKKFFSLFSFLLASVLFSQNVVEIHYRHVPAEHIPEFEAKEMDHWSKVKQNAIEVHFVKNDLDPTGLGEPTYPPTFGALANALYQGQGKRFYKQPFLG